MDDEGGQLLDLKILGQESFLLEHHLSLRAGFECGELGQV